MLGTVYVAMLIGGIFGWLLGFWLEGIYRKLGAGMTEETREYLRRTPFRY